MLGQAVLESKSLRSMRPQWSLGRVFRLTVHATSPTMGLKTSQQAIQAWVERVVEESSQRRVSRRSERHNL